MRRFFLFITFLETFALARAQSYPKNGILKNLVPNGSFENYRRKSSDIRKAIPWRSIQSVDYYQAPLSNDTTAERGAFSGNCYGGYRFRKNYREYLQVKLAEPLHRGTVYEFSMHIRLAFWSNVVLRSFGAAFTKGGYTGPGDAGRGSMVDTVCTGTGLHNNYRWIAIRGFYKADGGEKFVTIGNFAPVLKKDMYNINVFRFGPRESYYFIDEISLFKARQFEEKVAVERVGPDYSAFWRDSSLQVKSNIKIGETIAISNIGFEDESYHLLPESYKELNKLANYLILNPGTEISINGHSDNAGLRYKNQRLSELRAREVFEYLITKGVQNKMYFKGYGGDQPVAGNDTEEGRARNRRVEFEIIKK